MISRSQLMFGGGYLLVMLLLTAALGSYLSTGMALTWAALLLVQNASFTTVSRARNSGSYGYHAGASVFSNGIWFAQMFIVVDVFERVKVQIVEGGWNLFYVAIAFYISYTVFSSVVTHWFLKKYIESGKRRVGA